MKRVALSVAILLAGSASVVASAEQNTRSVSQATCRTVKVIHQDGSSDETTTCHTTADGTR